MERIRRTTLISVALSVCVPACDRDDVENVGKDVREAAGVVEQATKELLTAAQKHARAVCQGLEKALRASAVDPTKEPAREELALDLAIKLVPFVGPVKRYANARALYEEAAPKNATARVQEAKRQCLLAATEEGLDIATLGSSAFSKVATAADLSVVFARATSTVASVTGVEEIDALAPLADKALESSIVNRAVTMLLTVPIAELVPPVDESQAD